jgi:tetratricopeptide (TPR) repeat protein
VGAAAIVLGCAGAPASRDPAAAAGGAAVAPIADTAPASIRALRIHVADKVTLSADGDVPNGFEGELRRAVERNLLQAGLMVVADAGQPHDVVARLEARLRSAAYLINGSVSLVAESAGTLIDEVVMTGELGREDRFADDEARKLVAALVRSPRLLGFADSRGAPPQALASPGAAKRKPKPPAEALTLAKGHYRQGTSFYNLTRYREALVEFEAAYMAAPDPAFLFNIAQCHRKMGNQVDAVKFYRNYLREDPRAPNRVEVEKRIQDLAKP